MMPPDVIQVLEEILLPQSFQQLQQSYDTAYDHTQFIQQLTARLTIVENALSVQQSRTPSMVKLSYNDTPIGVTHTSKPVALSKLPIRSSSYRDDDNRYMLNYYTDIPSITLIAALYHEAEHAAQWMSTTYNQQERRMCCISRALYPEGGVNVQYLNNFAEIKARIAAAQFYIRVYHHFKDTQPEYVMSDAFFHPFKHAIYELTLGVTPENIKNLLASNIKQLRRNEGVYDVPIKAAFPAPIAQRQQAILFLQLHGMRLYQEVYDEMKSTESAMQQIVQTIEKQKQEELLSLQRQEHINDRHKMLEISSQYSMVRMMPVPRPSLSILVRDSTALQQQLARCSPYHNLAICWQDSEDVFVLADISPIPRPYSVNPQLKEQWERAHPASDIDKKGIDDTPLTEEDAR